MRKNKTRGRRGDRAFVKKKYFDLCFDWQLDVDRALFFAKSATQF